MPIRLKILIPMILLTLISGSAILISNIFQFGSYVNESINENIKTASGVAVSAVETLKSRANVASIYMSQDPVIVESLASGDRDTLMSRSKDLQAVTGVNFCTIADASGIAIARPHKPDSYGDDVTGMPSVQSALSGKSLTVIEEGTSVRMSACSSSPIYDAQGKLLGVACVGFRLDTDEFVDSVKNLIGCEVTVFLKDERISTTVKKDDGTRAVGTKSASDVSEIVLKGGIYSGRAKILEHDAYTEYTPIIGNNGKAIGMLFTGEYTDKETDTTRGFLRTGFLILLMVLLISILIILYITNRIVKPIGIMVNAAKSLADGDIDINIQVNTKDETLELAKAFNGMIENMQKQAQIIKSVANGDLSVAIEPRSDKDIINNALKTMLSLNNEVLTQIALSTEQVSVGAKQIADGSQALAQGASEQAASVEEFSASLAELEKEIRINAENSATAKVKSDQAGALMSESVRSMAQMLEAMKEIDESSKSITKVIKAIDDIAFQTNILSLNAAVEAAKAGDAGKGFAIVADEVRNLASKSAEAAKETAILIEESSGKVREGNKIVEKTNASLELVAIGAKEAGELLQQVAASSSEQSKSIEEMSRSILQISSIIQSDSASAEESAAASEEISAQASMLNEIVAKFNLKNPTAPL